MNAIVKKNLIFILILALCLVSASSTTVFAQDYRALRGLNSVNTIFDFRMDNPQGAVDHLQLVLITYQNKYITDVAKNPDFVVVFMGPSVKLLTREGKGVSGEKNQQAGKIAHVLTQLKNAGVRLEVCEVAMNAFGVDKRKLLPELTPVGNGWISSIGYQNKGYALVPIF